MTLACQCERTPSDNREAPPNPLTCELHSLKMFQIMRHVKSLALVTNVLSCAPVLGVNKHDLCAMFLFAKRPAAHQKK